MNRRSFLLMLESVLAAPLAAADLPSQASKEAPAGNRIIVIGAGLAGLAASRQLTSLGYQVVVIEGRDRTGGRIHTSQLWKDCPIDLGATWIHGIKGNPLSILARDAKARMLSTSYDDSSAYHTNGTKFSADDERAVQGISQRIATIIRKAQQSDKDQALGETLKSLIGPAVDADDARLARFVLSSEFEQEYAGGINELSTHWFDSAQSFAGVDQFFVDGFRVITEHLAKGLDILHNHIVRSIDWSAPVVRVNTSVREYTADRVLVTLPLGVLKTGDVAFLPALPVDKNQAINKLGVGVLNKCYLRFAKAFWPEDVDWIEHVPDAHGKWSEWVSFMKAVRQPVLLGFNAADQGRAIEKLTDAETLASAMKTLRTLFGGNIPDPIGHQITRWSSDPFANGSYSFNAVGSKPTMRKALASPLQSRLFFAGEATEAQSFGTAHGAYLSGLRAAKEIHAARR
jgi:monoamine oxidase